jgi:GNAT superfamily N-acetyltransferase
MEQFTSSFLDELEKVAKKSSKKKRAAGIGAGATSGAMMGAPAGLLMALGLIARKPRRYKITPPSGIRAQLKYFRGNGFARDLKRVQRDASKKALKGVAIGGGAGAVIGGLAGHEISKHGAVISSRITPQSSSVRGFSYDKKSGNMLVTFKSGGTYRYKGVTPAVAKAMGRNKSVGKTVHKRLKKGGYEYEKVGAKKKQKNYKCKFCKEQATKGIIWAEGRAIVPCCDKHLAKGKVSLDDPNDIDWIRDLTKQSSVTLNRPTAVIVKGNPKYIDGNAQADKFYGKLAKFVESKGYAVSFDPGTPHTSPKKADLWIGHSRGIDRLRFAPKGTATIAMGSPEIKGTINHPLDKAAVGKTPTKHHYMLTSPMKDELSGRMTKTSMVSERIREGKHASMIKEAPKNAQERFVASRSGTKDSPSAKYYAKKRRDARMAKKAGDDGEMKKMQQAISSFLAANNLPRNNPHVVIAGGAMYGHGLRKEFDDIDIIVPGLKGSIKEEHNGIDIDAGGTYNLGGKDLSKAVMRRAHRHRSGVNLMSPQDILDFKRYLNRPKDQRDVGVLEKHLAKQASGGYVLSEYTKKGDNDSDRDVQRIDVHHKGKNVGFQTYHPGSDGDYVWVKSLYVDPKHRGKGVATLLMDEVERKNKGKELRLRARPFRDKSMSADELKEIYGRRGYVQYDDKNRMVKKASSAQILSNLEARAEKVAAPLEGASIMNGMVERREEIGRMAEKVAGKHPIARFLLNPKTTGVGAAGLLAATGDVAATPLALLAAAGRHRGNSTRSLALLDRIKLHGGKGIMRTEKKHLAEAMGVSVPKIERMIDQASKRPIPKRGLPRRALDQGFRAATSKYNPGEAAVRALNVRYLADKVSRGKNLNPYEQEMIKILGNERISSKGKKLLMGGAALGAGATLAHRSK